MFCTWDVYSPTPPPQLTYTKTFQFVHQTIISVTEVEENTQYYCRVKPRTVLVTEMHTEIKDTITATFKGFYIYHVYIERFVC